MGGDKVRALVSTHWLWKQIRQQVNRKTTDRRLRILDTTNQSDRDIDSYSLYYLKEHIPQSLFFDLHKCVSSTDLFPRNLPDISCFTDYAQILGVHDDTHIVAYDRFGRFSAYRTWWLFRLFGHSHVSVLDGGLKKWIQDGYVLTSEVPTVERSQFQVRFNSKLIRDFNAMKENVKTHQEQVMDSRAYDSFSGLDDEPEGGHIPGARSIAWTRLFNDDHTMKSEEELQQLFDEAGIDLKQPVVAMCTKAMSACCLAAAAHVLGRDTVPVYYGSWWEWRQRAPPDMKTKTWKS